ncbi:hypothetical protein BGX38DRAFT_44580 [Terfezia claveryi]|nr:hypothetical protein BGX38DRAFT_44580 [Terfezia claveryi]
MGYIESVGSLLIDIRIQWLFWGIEYLVRHQLMINRHFGFFFQLVYSCASIGFLVDVHFICPVCLSGVGFAILAYLQYIFVCVPCYTCLKKIKLKISKSADDSRMFNVVRSKTSLLKAAERSEKRFTGENSPPEFGHSNYAQIRCFSEVLVGPQCVWTSRPT